MPRPIAARRRSPPRSAAEENGSPARWPAVSATVARRPTPSAAPGSAHRSPATMRSGRLRQRREPGQHPGDAPGQQRPQHHGAQQQRSVQPPRFTAHRRRTADKSGSPAAAARRTVRRWRSPRQTADRSGGNNGRPIYSRPGIPDTAAPARHAGYSGCHDAHRRGSHADDRR